MKKDYVFPFWPPDRWVTNKYKKIITHYKLFRIQVIVHSLSCVLLLWPQISCPSPSPWLFSNTCALSQWCHPTISSSVVPFSSHLQSFPASGSFPMSWLFTSGGQSTGASASASVLPMNIQDWLPLGLTGLISLMSKRLSRVSSSTTVWKHQSSVLRLLYGPTLTSIHWKNHSFDYMGLYWQSDVSAFEYAVLFSHLLSLGGSVFHIMAVVTIHSDFGAQENKICHSFHFLTIYLPWTDGTRCHDLHFLKVLF